MRLHGIDVSHWNGSSAHLMKNGKNQFVIAKATEGRTYVDPLFHRNIVDAVSFGLHLGAYHYARPDRNMAISEAENFVKTVEPYLGKIILALDYEGDALRMPGKELWARTWLDKVYLLTGIKPLIYLQGSEVKNFKTIADGDYGLWIAAWCDEEDMWGYVKHWKNPAIWQYTSNNGRLDENYFFGTFSQFDKYGEYNLEPEEDELMTPEKDHRCGCSCCDGGDCCG